MNRRPLSLNSRSQLRWSTLSLNVLLSRGPLGALRSRRPFQLSSPRLRLMDMLVDLPDMLLVDLPSLLRPSGSDQPLSGAFPRSPISKHQRTTKSSKLRFRRTHRQRQPPEAVAAVARGRAEANPSTVSATHNQVARTGAPRARRSSTGIHPGGHVHTREATFTPGRPRSHPGGHVHTREATFTPGRPRSHPGGHVHTREATFTPGRPRSRPETKRL